MSNHYQIKARAILSDASMHSDKLQTQALEMLEKGELDSRDMMFLEQMAVQNKIFAALNYTLMGLPDPVNVSEINIENPAPEQAEAPKDPSEPGQPEPEEEDPAEAFFRGLDETLTLLHSLSPVIHFIRGPRPVKDTPQA